MKSIFLAFIIVFVVFSGTVPAVACTTFCLQKDGRILFGKNYDWVTGTGMIHTNLAGLRKSALIIENGTPLTWTSKYGSITFNQFGKEFPNGGMNENGLVIELMWLNESSYPQKDSRPSLSVLQWIQFQLDNASSVEEVIASDKLVRIFHTGTPQHYMVADRRGAVATVEFLNGRMVTHYGPTLPYRVLANSPYATSLEAFNSKSGHGNNSLERFSTACEMVKTFETQPANMSDVDYAFEVLAKVAQGSFTKWSIVYDINNREIYFQTGNGKRRSVGFKQFSFSCDAAPKSYNLGNNHHGEVSNYFAGYSASKNLEFLKKAFRESQSQFKLAPALQEQMGRLADDFPCVK